MKKLKNILRYLMKHKIKAWIVGGYPRDMLLKKNTPDIDIVLQGNARQVSEKISKKFKLTLVVLHEEKRIYRLICDGYHLDFSQIRGKTLLNDLSRRDFTINSMAIEINPLTSKAIATGAKTLIIDPFGGRSALRNKRIDVISEKNLIDDPLRILRAYRLASTLVFGITKKTRRGIRKYSSLVLHPAKERIRDEISKILSVNNSYGTLDELYGDGVLEKIFPEIRIMKNSPGRFYFHPGGLWEHSLKALRGIEKILSDAKKYFPGLSGEITAHISTRLVLIKIVTLFHDIAKPATVRKIDGRVRFFGHESVGAKMVKRILTRLRFSGKDVSSAVKMVQHHMRAGNLFQAKFLTHKAVYRFFRDTGDEAVDIFLLSCADRLSYVGVTSGIKDVEKFIAFAGKMIERYFEFRRKAEQPKLLNGHVLMKKFNLAPGPVIGELLRIVDEYRSAGKIETAGQALHLLRKKLPKILKKFKRKKTTLKKTDKVK